MLNCFYNGRNTYITKRTIPNKRQSQRWKLEKCSDTKAFFFCFRKWQSSCENTKVAGEPGKAENGDGDHAHGEFQSVLV